MKANTLFPEALPTELADVEFSEIFQIDYLQQLQDYFSSTTGVMSVLTFPDGIPITKVSNYCGRCGQKSKRLASENADCELVEVHKDIAQNIKQLPNNKINYSCVFSGIWSNGVPIIIQGKHMATWLIANTSKVVFNALQQIECAKKRGDNHQEIVQKIAEQPVLSEMEFDRINTIFFGFVQGIATSTEKDLRIKKLLSDQQIANDLLKINEMRYHTMLESLQEGIIVVQDGLLQYCNPKIEEMSGRVSDEIIGRTAFDFIHPDDREMVKENFSLRIQGVNLEHLYNFRIIKKNGDIVWVEISVQKIDWNGKSATLNTLTDITIRKGLQDALEESEEKFRLIAENTSVGILSLDAQGNMLYASPSYFQHFRGTTISTCTSETIYDNIHPQDRDEVFKNIYAAINSKNQGLTYAYRSKLIEDGYFWRKDNANFIYDSQGNYVKAYVICRDISKRKQVEEALAESEQNLELAQQIASIGSWNWDSRTDKLTFSKEMYQVLDIDPLTFDGSRTVFEDRIHPEDKNLFNSNELNYLCNNNRQCLTVRIIHTNGTVRNIQITRKIEFDEANIPIKCFGVAQDITERIIAEKEKYELEMMRQLIAHTEKVREEERLAISRDLHDDIGQLLTAVKIDLALTKKQTTDANTALQIADTYNLVDNTIKTVQRLTSQLRPVIIDDLGLLEAIKWYANDFSGRYKIEFNIKIDKKIEVSKEASSIVFRIFQESLTNIARHAKATKVDVQFSNFGNSYQLRISDNGIGINQLDMESKTAYGLMGMRERAASLGGRFEIMKKKSVGSVVTFIFK